MNDLKKKKTKKKKRKDFELTNKFNRVKAHIIPVYHGGKCIWWFSDEKRQLWAGNCHALGPLLCKTLPLKTKGTKGKKESMNR